MHAKAIKAIDPQLKAGGPSTSVFVPDARYAGETHDREAEFATGQAPDPDALAWQPVWMSLTRLTPEAPGRFVTGAPTDPRPLPSAPS